LLPLSERSLKRKPSVVELLLRAGMRLGTAGGCAGAVQATAQHTQKQTTGPQFKHRQRPYLLLLTLHEHVTVYLHIYKCIYIYVYTYISVYTSVYTHICRKYIRV
jgi:hypothetical protein